MINIRYTLLKTYKSRPICRRHDWCQAFSYLLGRSRFFLFSHLNTSSKCHRHAGLRKVRTHKLNESWKPRTFLKRFSTGRVFAPWPCAATGLLRGTATVSHGRTGRCETCVAVLWSVHKRAKQGSKLGYRLQRSPAPLPSQLRCRFHVSCPRL